MDRNIKLHQVAGPFGDCTSAYAVEFPEGLTVKEFIPLVVNENPDEWGRIALGWIRPTLAEYRHGSIVYTELFHKYKTREIFKIEANGGWSLMDYNITLKPEPKPHLEVDINAKTQFPF